MSNEQPAKPDALARRPGRFGGPLRGPNQDRNLSAERRLPSPAPAAAPEALRPTPLPSWPEAPRYAELLLETRRTRKRRLLARAALFIALPTLLAFFYTLFWATPRYTTEFEISYQTYRPPQSLSSGLIQSIIGTSQNNTIDLGSLLYEYIRSPALLAELDRQLGLRQYLSSDKIDYLSRMSPQASQETFLRYYRWYVAASEGFGGYVQVEISAFDPHFAVTLARAIIQACDKMVNDLTMKAREDEMRVAKDLLAQQEERFRQARLALTEFQNAHGDLDPQHAASQLGNIAGGLEAQLAAARAELADALSYMQPDSPKVAAIRYKISGLEQQLKHEQQRLADNDSSKTPYSKILDEYSALQLEEQFARDAYLSAQQGLAVARADAARQENYLIDFAPPVAPDRPTAYFPMTATLTVFLLSLVVFVVGSLLTGAFRDQAGL